MKKLIAAIVIASIGAAFADPYYVYDYKASIKRLEISAKRKSSVVTQKYSVKSDSIIGYVTLPVCKKCSGTMSDSLVDIKDGDGYAYLTLKSNSKLVKDKPYAVIKAPITASIGVFGGEQKMNGEIVDDKKVNQAWMALDIPMPNKELLAKALLVVKNASAEVPFGFFGLTNQGNGPVEVKNTGFGTAKNLSNTTFDFCDGESKTSCFTVSTISGTLVGYPKYQAACEHTPIWNLCDVSDAGEINQAVISGTWSLKFNKKLTNDSNDADGKFDETAILTKLGTSTYVLLDAKGAFENTWEKTQE